MRDPRYDVLFEPVAIGPVTAKNRFYQVPHCSGMGYSKPQSLNRMREVNAEGGWAVVCTEFCSIHPSSLGKTPATLWDEGDVRVLGDLTDRVRAHGALAGVELWYGGISTPNHLTREVPLGPVSLPVWDGPLQTQAMDRSDIRALKRWHRDAALRAKRAGFEIIYVYAGHGYLPAQFLSPTINQRTDEYGGSFENRARLIRELLDETKEAVGDSCAVAFRFSVEDLNAEIGITHDGEGRDLVEYLAEVPDLWDVNLSNYAADVRSSRFVPEGAQENYVAFVKQVTTKPVVGVGRFTSPDTMVSQIKRGILDFIGAARPSIADPFLPKKIETGRIDEIRECIGCNICVWSNAHTEPLRCTQNATRGEEWRRHWHPEQFEPRHADESVLVIGAGPAGLEAARVLGERGYEVALAEATKAVGGRVSFESSLPGLSEWARVRDYRLSAIRSMPAVEIYLDSRLGSEQVLEFGFRHVCIATGSRWRTDGVGRSNSRAFLGWENQGVWAPDMISKSSKLRGICLVYDDDGYYMANVLAERLMQDGNQVIYVTSTDSIAPEASATLEQSRIQARIMSMGAEIITAHKLKSFDGRTASLECAYTGARIERECSMVVPVTGRHSNDSLYHQIMANEHHHKDAGISSVQRIGDCQAPGLIASAVFAGHRYARELGSPLVSVGRDRVILGRPR